MKKIQMVEKNCMLGILILLLAFLISGCGIEETDTKKLKDLSYDILDSKEIPEEFSAVIEEKKEMD